MSNKKVLVTGASGFIGNYLIDALIKEGWNVRALVRKRNSLSLEKYTTGLEISQGDIRSIESLLIAVDGVDAVIHLAAATSEKASTADESYEVNVKGMENLIAACKMKKVKRIIAVSTQSTKREKQGNYGKTKSMAYNLLLLSGLDYTIIKPTLVYGGGSKGLFAKIFKLIERLPLVP